MMVNLPMAAILFLAMTAGAMQYGSVGFQGKPGKEFRETIAEAAREKIGRQELLEKIKQMEMTKTVMNRENLSLDDITLALGENFIFVATYNSNIFTFWDALGKGDTADNFIEKMFIKRLRELLAPKSLPEI